MNDDRSMGYEYKPDQAADNQKHRDKNYYFLQNIHIFSWLVCC
jgi:hypothetical protein